MRLKKTLGIWILVLSLLVGNFTAYAVEVVQIPDANVQTVYNQSVQSNQIENWPKGPQIYSEAGIVMDIDSGAILYAKNIDEQHYPASITKIMTALVALENYELDETVKFTWDDVGFLEYGDAHIGIGIAEGVRGMGVGCAEDQLLRGDFAV